MSVQRNTDEYPQADELEEHLKYLAIEVGETMPKPFRVDLVKVHGGKPPVYSVVIRSKDKEPLRMRLEQLLSRPLTCGISSFMLKASEAKHIVKSGSH